MRALFLLALGLAGCAAPPEEVRMVDPRNGVIASCSSGPFNDFTYLAKRAAIDACRQELAYYGFREQGELRAIGDIKPPTQQRRGPWDLEY